MKHISQHFVDKILALISSYKKEVSELSDQGKIVKLESILFQIEALTSEKLELLDSTRLKNNFNEVYRKKILLVDDDKLTLAVLQKALEKGGYTIAVESNPLEALSRIKSELPDLIILDLIMPQMTGFEFLQQIRSNPRYDGIKIAIGSSRSDPEDLASVFKEGADEFIPKPFDLRVVEQIIDELLNIKAA